MENLHSQLDIKELVKTTIESLLESNIQMPELLSTQEASKYFGQSDGYWKKQIFQRNINFVKMGKSVRLKKSDIEKFIAKRTIEVA